MAQNFNFQQRNTSAADRRRRIKELKLKDAQDKRDMHMPIAITMILSAIILILVKVIVLDSFSSNIEEGKVPNIGGDIVGPIDVESSETYALEVEYDMSHVSSKWCNLTILLLDKNKNYITGCEKDLYHVIEWGDKYAEEDMKYVLNINKPGKYYYQFLTKHQSKSFRLGHIKYSLSTKPFSTGGYITLAIWLLVLGIPYLVWTVLDWELTNYTPDLTSKKSKGKIIKTFLVVGGIFLIIFISNLSGSGYADLENAPSSSFDHDGTHYFGKS